MWMDLLRNHPSSETITARLRMVLPALFAVIGMVRREAACVLLFFRRIEQMLALFRAGELPVVTVPAPRRDVVLTASRGALVSRRLSSAPACGARDVVAVCDEVARIRVRIREPWPEVPDKLRILGSLRRVCAVREVGFAKMGLSGRGEI